MVELLVLRDCLFVNDDIGGRTGRCHHSRDVVEQDVEQDVDTCGGQYRC